MRGTSWSGGAMGWRKEPCILNSTHLQMLCDRGPLLSLSGFSFPIAMGDLWSLSTCNCFGDRGTRQMAPRGTAPQLCLSQVMCVGLALQLTKANRHELSITQELKEDSKLQNVQSGTLRSREKVWSSSLNAEESPNWIKMSKCRMVCKMLCCVEKQYLCDLPVSADYLCRNSMTLVNSNCLQELEWVAGREGDLSVCSLLCLLNCELWRILSITKETQWKEPNLSASARGVPGMFLIAFLDLHAGYTGVLSLWKLIVLYTKWPVHFPACMLYFDKKL